MTRTAPCQWCGTMTAACTVVPSAAGSWSAALRRRPSHSSTTTCRTSLNSSVWHRTTLSSRASTSSSSTVSQTFATWSWQNL
uniref:Putative secreted protein n=1 Tax=Ixodes ricinus TaxID=34613 RepID=A0A6B0U6K4_IXORI